MRPGRSPSGGRRPPGSGRGSNRSTGYCPDPDCRPSVAAALDRAGIPRPAGFTHAFVFRHCTGRTALDVVREEHFVRVFCGEDRPGVARPPELS
ncbi:hypothetical protein GCM10010271_25410 [Streptomyces kurssanovii]|nr:hypothetical protein GCM10010271_25410 [Streptomyces kurssanovii]